jgi:hypothetical protein
MPYLNVDDGMDEHPKVDALSDAAYRLLMASLHYCARNLTDGFLPLGRARRLTATGKDATAAELVQAGVWHDLGEGCDDPECIERRTCHAEGRKGHYIVHDYLQWNHSKQWWDERRAAEAERKRKWRATRGQNAGQDAGVPASVTPSVPASVPPGRHAGRDEPEPEPEQTPDTRTIPTSRGRSGGPITALPQLQAARANPRRSNG